MVKHKYHIKQDEDNEIAGELENNINYFLPVLLYVALTSSCFFISLLVFNELYGEDFNTLHQTKNLSRLVFAFTFLGAFLWTLNYLLRRVANYDLSPLSYFRAFYRILLSLVIVGAVYYSGVFHSIEKEEVKPTSAMVQMSPPNPALVTTIMPAVESVSSAEEAVRKTGQATLLIIAIALLVGLFPLAFIDLLVARFPSLALRRVDGDDKRLMKEYPLDMIIGIDPYMKFRLSEFEIEDVQNLATANPIQIFVETPYGLYEVIDWIAQAQLIIAVGSKKTRLLRAINIRTVFDLENIGRDPRLREEIYHILLGELEPVALPDGTRIGKGGLGPPKDVLDDVVMVITDDLYIKRLRQLWSLIEKKLD
ncbi:hypothetical protein C1N62_11490 [Nissabacter sp. SGAir0207]|nr:hypothetical protein C1N62_11490 [Nissabacter sp. SGAir0207]